MTCAPAYGLGTSKKKKKKKTLRRLWLAPTAYGLGTSNYMLIVFMKNRTKIFCWKQTEDLLTCGSDLPS